MGQGTGTICTYAYGTGQFFNIVSSEVQKISEAAAKSHSVVDLTIDKIREDNPPMKNMAEHMGPAKPFIACYATVDAP